MLSGLAELGDEEILFSPQFCFSPLSMDATIRRISHARTACVILVVVAAMLPCGEGHVRDKMDKVKEWFDHGSISDVQKAAEHDGGKSAGEGVCARENMRVCVRVCARVCQAFRSKESLCKLRFFIISRN